MVALRVVARDLAFAACVAFVVAETAMLGSKVCVEVARGASCFAGRNAGCVDCDFAFVALVGFAVAAADAAVG